jgi:hypothetical protein
MNPQNASSELVSDEVRSPPPESARRRAWRRAREREREARRILAMYYPDCAALDLPCEVLSFTRDRIVFELGGSMYDIRRPKAEDAA